MDARQLLQSIEARGGVATVKTDESGAAKINVAPRSLALELLPDLQRFKPALLELLGADTSEPAQNRAEIHHATEGENGPPIGLNRGESVAPDDETARQRVRPELRAVFCDADSIAIGANLLRLDAGLEIE